MVCLPCFIVPVLLYIFHKFIQPFILRFWNPWEKKDSEGNVIKTEPRLFDCKDGVCSFAAFSRKKVEDNPAASVAEKVDHPVEEVNNGFIEKKHK